MRRRMRWVSAMVVTGVTIGGAAGAMETSSPKATSDVTSTTSTTVPRDVVSPEISRLASEAHKLSVQIVAVDEELSHLQQLVTSDAARSHNTASTTTTTTTTQRVSSDVTPTKAQRHHPLTPSTTTSTTSTTTTTATTTTLDPTTTSPPTHATTGASGGEGEDNGD